MTKVTPVDDGNSDETGGHSRKNVSQTNPRWRDESVSVSTAGSGLIKTSTPTDDADVSFLDEVIWRPAD